MRIKRVKSSHITNCTYCKAEGKKVRAGWYATGSNHSTACPEHFHMLEAMVKAHNAVDQQDPSEADYQTWMRL